MNSVNQTLQFDTASPKCGVVSCKSSLCKTGPFCGSIPIDKLVSKIVTFGLMQNPKNIQSFRVIQKWSGLWTSGIHGTYFFKIDDDHNVTVNGNDYRATRTDYLLTYMTFKRIVSVISSFKTNITTSHITCERKKILAIIQKTQNNLHFLFPQSSNLGATRFAKLEKWTKKLI